MLTLHYEHEVDNIKRTKDGLWELKSRNLIAVKVEHHTAKFVFIGGGGGSLPLLQKTGIPEGKAYRWIPSKWIIPCM